MSFSYMQLNGLFFDILKDEVATLLCKMHSLHDLV